MRSLSGSFSQIASAAPGGRTNVGRKAMSLPDSRCSCSSRIFFSTLGLVGVTLGRDLLPALLDAGLLPGTAFLGEAALWVTVAFLAAGGFLGTDDAWLYACDLPAAVGPEASGGRSACPWAVASRSLTGWRTLLGSRGSVGLVGSAACRKRTSCCPCE